MGMPIGISKSSFEPNYVYINNNPNPLNYKILGSWTDNNKKHLLLMVQYHDCNNFEGKKLLLFKDCKIEQIKSQKSLDPHFSSNKNFISPIARFEPSLTGFKIAELVLDSLDSLDRDDRERNYRLPNF